MRNRALPLLVAAVAVSLCAAAASRADDVTVNATVAGGATLSVSSLNAPSFPVTLNGDDQTGSYQAQLQVIDARGLASGGGWHMSIVSTRYSDGAGHTLPANASTISTITAGCHIATSTCAIPVNSVVNSGLGIPTTAPATTILNAASSSGLGRIDVNVNVDVKVPANTIAGTYASTLTVAIAAGP